MQHIEANLARHQERREQRAREVLSTLPTREFKGDNDDSLTCAVCIGEFEDADIVRVLPCAHEFHKTCVDPWLSSHHTYCIVCLLSVTRADDFVLFCLVVHSANLTFWVKTKKAKKEKKEKERKKNHLTATARHTQRQ